MSREGISSCGAKVMNNYESRPICELFFFANLKSCHETRFLLNKFSAIRVISVRCFGAAALAAGGLKGNKSRDKLLRLLLTNFRCCGLS